MFERQVAEYTEKFKSDPSKRVWSVGYKWYSVPCLIEDNTGLGLSAYLLLCIYKGVYIATYACTYIYRGGAL